MSKFFVIVFCLLCAAESLAQPFGDPKAIVYGLDIQPDSNFVVAIVGARKKIEVWNYANRKLIKSWTIDLLGYSVAITGNYVAVAIEGGKIEFYEVLTGNRIFSQDVSDGTITDLKGLVDGRILAADSQNNVYRFTLEGTDITFSKLFTSMEPIISLNLLPKKDIVMVGHPGGTLSTWSLSNGTRLGQQFFDANNPHAFVSCADDAVASINSREIGFYKVNAANQLVSSWDLATKDRPGSVDCRDNVLVFGTTSGTIRIYSAVARYQTKVNAMINFARLIPSEQKYIKVLIGTHGLGMRVIDASKMEISK